MTKKSTKKGRTNQSRKKKKKEKKSEGVGFGVEVVNLLSSSSPVWGGGSNSLDSLHRGPILLFLSNYFSRGFEFGVEERGYSPTSQTQTHRRHPRTVPPRIGMTWRTLRDARRTHTQRPSTKVLLCITPSYDWLAVTVLSI